MQRLYHRPGFSRPHLRPQLSAAQRPGAAAGQPVAVPAGRRSGSLAAHGDRHRLQTVPLPPPRQAGFIRLPLVCLLAAVACIIALTGCATTGSTTSKDTPLQTAGKSLLAVKSSIVTAATATDNLCKVGTLKPDTCSKAKTAYEVAKPAYDTAVDAYLLMSSGGGDAANFGAALLRVQNLAAHLLSLSGGAQ